jgi:hypothetical protein
VLEGFDFHPDSDDTSFAEKASELKVCDEDCLDMFFAKARVARAFMQDNAQI